MNNQLKRLSSIAFAALLMLSIVTAIPVAYAANLLTSTPPSDPIAMWIEPLTVDPNVVGYTFSIVVWAQADVNTKGWQMQLIYNNKYLNTSTDKVLYVEDDGTLSATGPSEFMTTSGMTTMPVAPAIQANTPDADHNRIDFGEAWMMGDPNSPKGPSRCANIEFTVIKFPNKGENLTDYFDISTRAAAGGTWIMKEDSSKVDVAYDAEYVFAWEEPPGPHLAVVPDTRFFDRYTEWVNTTFTESIYLKDLSPLWYLTNVSLTLNYNETVLQLNSVTMNNVDWNVAATYDDTVAGLIDMYVETNQSLAGDILIATVEFEIIFQGDYPLVTVVDLTFTNVTMFDHTLEITPQTPVEGEITIEGFLAVAMPWMEVKPEVTTMGSEFGECIKHQTFQVEVTVNRLHPAWKLVGIEFRLGYDDFLLEVVSITEGPYLGDYAPYGTWFVSYVEPDYYGPHVLVGNMILPNSTGYWNPPFPGAEEGQPGENGTIAIITFKVLYQTTAFPPEIIDEAVFDLFNIRMVNNKAELIPVDEDKVVDGKYEAWSGSQQGRFIDVYGGAENAGYGSIPFPAPYGGQGLNMPMDLVIPQSEVTLFANVTYNFWPVQQKDVGFEVEGPYNHTNGEYIPKENHFILLKETARTDEDGVATISFAMPWPCDDPESLLGVWKVTVAVNIRDEIVIDTLYFYYDYMVHISKVTTDKFYYAHGETVVITVEYGSHAMQMYPALFAVAIKDELNVVIGMDLFNTTVGGAVFCTFAEGIVTLEIFIPKWAFAGYADLYVNVYDKDPTEGGFAWTPQYYEEGAIYIQPV